MIRHLRAVRAWNDRRAATQTAAGQPDATLEGGEVELRLAEIPLQEMVELVRIDLPADDMEPLLELGLLPGCQVCPVRRSPFGDPVLRVEGSLIALRREMAHCLCVRRGSSAGEN